jgi:negative regulator of flagellin synthesis FlgM
MRMDIRNSLDGLKSLLGVESTAPATARPTRSTQAEETALGSDRATLSSAGTGVSQASHEDGVRMDKVASIQAALATSTYEVPAAAVATKLVDVMLGGRK